MTRQERGLLAQEMLCNGMTLAEAAAALGIPFVTAYRDTKPMRTLNKKEEVAKSSEARNLCSKWPIATMWDAKKIMDSVEKCSGCYWGKASGGGKIVCFWRECEGKQKNRPKAVSRECIP